MKYKISDDRKTLTVTASHVECLALRRQGPDIHSDKLLYETFEPLTSNSELEWIDPAETGDLTSAPMLGIRESQRNADNECRDAEVIERWAFMDYQVRSVLEDLRDKGNAVFVS